MRTRSMNGIAYFAWTMRIEWLGYEITQGLYPLYIVSTFGIDYQFRMITIYSSCSVTRNPSDAMKKRLHDEICRE